MVTTLFLIRHGETKDSGTKRYQGSTDVALSDRGIAQAGRAASFVHAYLKKTAPDRGTCSLGDVRTESARAVGHDNAQRLAAVYCSDLSRAVKSAEIVAGPHECEPVRIPGLRERSFGIWEDMSFLEIQAQYPAEFNTWADNPLQYAPVNGESTLDLRNRVLPAFNRILDSHAGQSIAIVAHGGVNRVLLCHILGIPLENIFRIEQDHAAVNIIEFWDGDPVVKCINHLPQEGHGNG